ncbi:MAG: EAL domain-containing protein, partial [Acidobacteriaceae bacterium]
MLVELSDLRAALDNNEVVPCFQPLVDLSSGRLAGFEVLARWQHPQEGPVLPDNFIALAEKNGLIWQLTQQVISKAFLALPFLGDTLVLAINVSPVQLRDFSLPSQIKAEA